MKEVHISWTLDFIALSASPIPLPFSPQLWTSLSASWPLTPWIVWPPKRRYPTRSSGSTPVQRTNPPHRIRSASRMNWRTVSSPGRASAAVRPPASIGRGVDFCSYVVRHKELHHNYKQHRKVIEVLNTSFLPVCRYKNSLSTDVSWQLSMERCRCMPSDLGDTTEDEEVQRDPRASTTSLSEEAQVGWTL